MYLFFLLFLAILPTFAHQSSLNSSGKELVWNNPDIPVSIQTNTSDMTAANVKNIIQSSMNEWNQSGSANLRSVSKSSNAIKFVSNFPFGSGVIGVTEISYNNRGVIQKASVLLNDDYYFHSSPGLYPSGQVYLGDVVTHELGHLFGLSHSEVLDSSMFFSSFSGQSTISADDRAGIRAKYDNYGTISGYVKGGDSIGVLGAHVQAISRKTGEAIGAISNANGSFRISGLDIDDTYYLYTSPVKNLDSLPGYFSNVQDKFCPASYVGSFFTACGRENDGKPLGINLSSLSPHFDVGTVTINCGLKTDPDYDLKKMGVYGEALTIYDYSTGRTSEKSFVGWFLKSNTGAWSVYDKFNIDLTGHAVSGTSKYLKVSLVSYPFGSQQEYEMSVLQNGTVLSSRTLTYSSMTETFNTDFYSYVPLSLTPSMNVFEVRVRAKSLSSSTAAQTFPSYLKFASDQHMPYLIITSLYENTAGGLRPILDSQVNLSDNEACLDGPYTFAVERATEASSPDATKAGDDPMAAAGCGTIEPPQNGPGSSLTLLAAGFLMVLFASSLIKSRKNFLS